MANERELCMSQEELIMESEDGARESNRIRFERKAT